MKEFVGLIEKKINYLKDNNDQDKQKTQKSVS